jgi:hypothetical protein
MKGSKYPGSNHNYSGPGTQLAKRLARGDKPINAVDAVSMQHDIDYGRAKTKKDVRDADRRAIQGYSNPQIAREDPQVAKIARNTFRAKLVTDRIGLTDAMKFTGSGARTVSVRPVTDRVMPMKKPIEEEEEAPPPPPGQDLRDRYLRELKKMKS